MLVSGSQQIEIFFLPAVPTEHLDGHRQPHFPMTPYLLTVSDKIRWVTIRQKCLMELGIFWYSFEYLNKSSNFIAQFNQVYKMLRIVTYEFFLLKATQISALFCRLTSKFCTHIWSSFDLLILTYKLCCLEIFALILQISR